MNKLEEVELCLKNELVDIACICESWSATEDVVAFEGYNTYFQPRMTPTDITVTDGGGVGIICRSSIRIEFSLSVIYQISMILKYYGCGAGIRSFPRKWRHW